MAAAVYVTSGGGQKKNQYSCCFWWMRKEETLLLYARVRVYKDMNNTRTQAVGMFAASRHATETLDRNESAHWRERGFYCLDAPVYRKTHQ